MSASAATELVEGHFIAGNHALDFANSVYRRWPEQGADLFTGLEALAGWLDRTGLSPAGDTGVTEQDLQDARALRALLWRVFDAQKDERSIPGDAVAGLLETACRSSAVLTFRPDGSVAAVDARGALAVIALRALGLVLDPPEQGVRACDRCGWFFIDSSRGRRRRWCSMKTCGNQAKAARFRSSRPG